MSGFGPTIQAMADDDFFIARRSDRLDPSRFDLNRSTDPSRAIRSVSEVFCPHEIIVHDRGAAIDFRHSSARIERTTFNQICYGSDLDTVIRDTNRSQYIFLVPLRGQMLVHSSAGSAPLEVGTYMLMGPDVPYRFSHDADDSHFAIGVPRRLIESGDAPVLSLVNGIGPETVTDPAGSLIDYLGFVCRELNRGGAAFDSPAVRASVEDSVIGMMKALQPGQEPVSWAPSHVIPGLVLRAERFMDQHLTDDIAIDDIAIAAGVPARTLYHAFTQFRGLSPMRSLRARRLEQARRDLITGAQGSVNILEIANRYGMQHGGRFAAHYQQQFHETPSETVRAARLALPSLLATFLDPER